jgi:hypothetical protein
MQLNSFDVRFRYPHFCISAVLFHCYDKHQYPIRGQILKPTTSAESSARSSENVMQTINLATKPVAPI